MKLEIWLAEGILNYEFKMVILLDTSFTDENNAT